MIEKEFLEKIHCYWKPTVFVPLTCQQLPRPRYSEVKMNGEKILTQVSFAMKIEEVTDFHLTDFRLTFLKFCI